MISPSKCNEIASGQRVSRDTSTLMRIFYYRSYIIFRELSRFAFRLRSTLKLLTGFDMIEKTKQGVVQFFMTFCFHPHE